MRGGIRVDDLLLDSERAPRLLADFAVDAEALCLLELLHALDRKRAVGGRPDCDLRAIASKPSSASCGTRRRFIFGTESLVSPGRRNLTATRDHLHCEQMKGGPTPL